MLWQYIFAKVNLLFTKLDIDNGSSLQSQPQFITTTDRYIFKVVYHRALKCKQKGDKEVLLCNPVYILLSNLDKYKQARLPFGDISYPEPFPVDYTLAILLQK